MLRVLFLCTGNRCRSPFAAACFRRLAGGLPVEVDSAGTANIGAQPSTAEAIETATSFGIDLRPHLSKPLEAVDVASFDAIVGFERAHVASAVVDGGASHERVFALPELNRLLNTPAVTPAGGHLSRASAALAAAHSLRGVDFVPGEEVDDPIGRSMRTYERVFTEIHDLTRAVGAVLLGPAAGRPMA